MVGRATASIRGFHIEAPFRGDRNPSGKVLAMLHATSQCKDINVAASAKTECELKVKGN